MTKKVTRVDKPANLRKQAGSALQASEERYRGLLTHLDAGVVVHAADTSVIMNNPRASALLGLSDKQMRGKLAIDPKWKFLKENRKPFPIEEYPVNQIASKRQAIKDLVLGINRPATNDVAWVSVNGFPVLDSKGEISEIVISFIDITDRKTAEEKLQDKNEEYEALNEELRSSVEELQAATEELQAQNEELQQTDIALRESEEKHKRMIANVSDVIAIMDKDGTLKYKSPNIEKWFGWQPEDLVNTDGWETVHPEDLERIQKEFFTLLDKDNSVETVEYRYKCKDGSYKLIALTAVNLTNDPVISGVLMNYHDITERKQAEEALRESEERFTLAIEGTGAGLWDWDMVQNQVLYSARWKRMLGYEVHEVEDTFSGWKNLWHPEDCANIEKALDDHLAGKTAHYEIIHRLRHKDGGWRWILTRGDIVKDAQGKPCRWVGTNLDITAQKQAEEEKLYLEERLTRSEKMESLGLLAGGVAHDLNNVLGIVVGYAEMVLDAVDEKSPLRKDLTTIFDGGQRAAAIVDDLLTLARRGVVGKKVLNLNKLIGDFKKSPQWSKLLTYHPSVKIQIELEQDLLNIAASSVHLEKTLYNLVSNASEAMTKGGNINIKTRNRYIDKPISGYDTILEGDYVVLSVSDEGDGISETDLKRIFEPFYTKKIMGRSGTGLGLSVVWGTVKDHQGYIDVQSEEGKGTTFTLYFLVTREDIEEESLAVSMSEYLGNGQSLLVVDDVKDQRDLAARLLASLNYKVSSVSSGEEAIEYLKENKVDILVLDMIMDPGLDGLDTYKSILEINPKQKAIIVSGFSESDRVKEAKTLGAGAYIKKPYIKEKLGMAVKKELARK